MWTTEATRALPGLELARDRGANEKSKHRCAHSDSLTGTDGDSTLYPFWGRCQTVLSRSRGRNLQLYVWMACLWAAAVFSGGKLVAADAKTPPWWVVLGLAVVAATADRQSVPVTKNAEASVAFLPLVFAAVAFGPLAGLTVGALAGLGDFRRPYLRWFAYMPVRALTGAITGLAAMSIDGNQSTSFGRILVAALAASVADLAT